MTIILQQKKGSGAQGAVYQGFIKNKNQQVAIKINTELSERESSILNIIKIQKQKHLIRLDAIENYQNQVIIVMELAEMDFYQFMATDQFKATSIDERNQFFFQMIQGVQEFHNLGYYHRDLKPENFVLCRDQNQNLVIKLIDFGISKIQEDGVQSMKVGTPFYMTKEILNNQSYNKSIDVWALGCIWYEILTGKTFIEGNTIQSIIQNINSIEQVKINLKIDQLKRIQSEQREILKQMICIDKNKRISIDEAIQKINEFFKKKELEKIEAEIKKEYEVKEKQLHLEKQKKIEELQLQLEQEKQVQIYQLQQQLRSEYDLKIEKKEIELKKILELQQGQDQENKAQLILQQTIKYQNDMNQFKTQCESVYKQKLNEAVQQIQKQQKESLEKKQKMENEELKKKINEQAKQQYQIQLNEILQQQQLEANNQQKKAQFQNKRQFYGQVLQLLKDTIQKAISTMNQQKQIIINLQLENQDKIYMLNSIQKFINDKEQELSQLYQEEENFNSLNEDQQFSKFVELETLYKNQIKIHIEEKSMIDIQINKFMADYVKKQEQIAREEKQLQEERKNQQEMNNQNKKFQTLQNQYNESQLQIQVIMKICENYSEYNQTITNNFQRLKENSSQIASRINQIQQYQTSAKMVTVEQIQLMKLELQEIQNEFQRLKENIISVNESISTYEEELKKQMQQYLKQIKDIKHKISIEIQQYNLIDKTILTQLQAKQQLMKEFCQKLDNLIESNISESIKEFMETKKKNDEEKSQVKKLLETLQKEQQSMTKIKLISGEQNKFQKEIETKSNNYQQQIEELAYQLNPIQQDCKKLKNQDIIQQLNTRFKELKDLKYLAKQQFDDLIQESKQNLESQYKLNQLKERGTNLFSELNEKKDEYKKQIIELNKISDSIFKLEQDNKLQKINYLLESLIQNFETKQTEFMDLQLQDYNYDEIVKQYNTKREQLTEQKRKLEAYKENYLQNISVTSDEMKKTSQNCFFKENTKRYNSQLMDTKERSERKFYKLQEVINEINKQNEKIKYIEVEREQQIQNEWLGKQIQIKKLDSQLHLFTTKIQQALQENQCEIDKLSEEFQTLQVQVKILIDSIPQKKDINKFQENFNRNKKSLMIACSLIIIIKAFNFQRYVVRIKEFQLTQQQKQSKKINQQIGKNATLTEDIKKKQFSVQVIKNKYKSWLKCEDLIFSIQDSTEDETYLDNLIKEIQNQINTQNNVKLKAKVRDQQFNKEFSSQFYDQLEYCRIIGMLKMQNFLMENKKK
ncbi:unnamed protein product [Paramecium octaurelia]|uniref:Protein kinase domain-containing protein n=1 Tax=Paramecium octaurelia TaxID=43137 RepID=A0A8S1T3W9_PAROT|nr:unnamed protein product [Paramecium octaurelia]